MGKSSDIAISFIEPMYALGVRNLPEGPDWLYEIKLDGYRCLAGKDASGVSLWSRRGNALTSQFTAIAKACDGLPTGTLVDGDIVATDAKGQVSFNTLQGHRSEASAIRFYVFDLLILRGRSMLGEPLWKRRESLSKLLGPISKKSSEIELSQTVITPAHEMIRAITELGLEGIMGKRQDSLYEPGKHSGAWVNIKLTKARSSSLAATHPAIPSTPYSLDIIRATSCSMLGKFALICAPCTARSHDPHETAENRCLPVRKSTGNETYPMGADCRRNEKLPVAQT